MTHRDSIITVSADDPFVELIEAVGIIYPEMDYSRVLNLAHCLQGLDGHEYAEVCEDKECDCCVVVGYPDNRYKTKVAVTHKGEFVKTFDSKPKKGAIYKRWVEMAAKIKKEREEQEE